MMPEMTSGVVGVGRRVSLGLPHAAGAISEAEVFAVLRKTWQPVGLSRGLGAGGILSYRLLGEEVVVARLGSGLMAARDLCPHRGAKFGLGAVVGDRLQCPYHGWEFGREGRCEKIPSLIDPSAVPASACLTTYAVKERYGLIWVRLDAEEAASLPEVPEYEDSGWEFVVPEPMRFGAGFRREVENYLDMSHFAFAHRTTLGVAATGRITDVTITHFDDGFRMDAPFPCLESGEGGVAGKLQSAHHRSQRVHLPNFTTIRQTFRDGDERVLLHVPSPNGEGECTVFWALATSPGFRGPPIGRQVEFAVRVLDEDRVMVENQRPLEVPLGEEPDTVLVAADRLANTYKGAIREFVVRGGLPRGGREAEGAEAGAKVSVLYGSQTGTAEGLAERLGRRLRGWGVGARVGALDSVGVEGLSGTVLVVASTTGDGDPPDNARGFFDALHDDGASARDLSHVRFAVLGLGDRKYTRFCRHGRELDARLGELGARRLLTLAEADGEPSGAFEAWSRDVARVLGVRREQEVVALEADAAEAGTSASNPLEARVRENRRLSRLDSEKETRHYEVEVGDAVAWEPGDALGVVPVNPPDVVEGVLWALGASGETRLADGRTLRTALSRHRELRRCGAALAVAVARASGDGALEALARDAGREEELAGALAGTDVYDLLMSRPGARGMDPQAFHDALAPLAPRVYSIASSPLACPGSVHLTVATVRYKAGRRTHHGVASTFLADRVRAGESVPVFVRGNAGFRLPSDPATDVVMVGPGTGVAPFRAFLQHREATGATGRNWLFFGDRNRATDFLYESELTGWLASGVLSRLDLAFSRDEEGGRTYVQDRMRASAEELRRWVEGGAWVYVCGDARRMARDVEATLGEVLTGGPDTGAGIEAVRELGRRGRYRRDVY